MESLQIAIATPPDGKLVWCPGLIISNALGVAELPITDEHNRKGYSVTQIPTGYCTGFFFKDRYLAAGCAMELADLLDWSGDTVETIEKAYRPHMDEIKAIRQKWVNRDNAEAFAEDFLP